jgi:hypothetical protein
MGITVENQQMLKLKGYQYCLNLNDNMKMFFVFMCNIL